MPRKGEGSQACLQVLAVGNGSDVKVLQIRMGFMGEFRAVRLRSLLRKSLV